MRARTIFATVVQLTWGFPQTGIGAFMWVILALSGRSHRRYRSATVTLWHQGAGLSLGPFIFIPEGYGIGQGGYAQRRLLAHEYGHTVQSLLLGPLYLPLIVIPSLVWAGIPALARRRHEQGTSYYSFYTERWANVLSRRVTGEHPEDS
jgi:hypothetical protein